MIVGILDHRLVTSGLSVWKVGRIPESHTPGFGCLKSGDWSRGGSEHLDGCPHQIVIHFYIPLGGGQVLVPGQLHDDLRADARVRQLGDEPAPTGMAGGTIEAGLLVEVAHELAKRVGAERRPLLRLEQGPFRFYRVAQCGPIPFQFLPQPVGHEHHPSMAALGDLAGQPDLAPDRFGVGFEHVADHKRGDFAYPHARLI